MSARLLVSILSCLALLPVGPGPQAQGFEPAGNPAGVLVRSAPARPEQGPGPVRYRLRDGRLVRCEGGGTERALGCTREGGTGAVHAWSHHPGGTTYVAAERGLFTVSVHGTDGAPVSDLDPLELYGAPVDPGAAVGVVCDGERLWVAFEHAFGCAHVAQRIWSGFGPEDGLPPGPFDGLSRDPGGDLLLSAGGEVYRYRPGRGAPPPPPALLGDTPVTVESDGRFTLALDAADNDRGRRASLQWRVHDDPVWRPLEPHSDPESHGLRARGGPLGPGSHGVRIVALDRELRSSPEVEVEVPVPYPDGLDPARLVWLALPLGLVAALGLARALRRGGRGGLVEAAWSLGLAGAVGLQLAAGLAGHGRGWPFVGFTMYSNVHRAEGQVYRMSLYGLRPDGTRVPGRLESFGAGYALFDLRRSLAGVIHGTEQDRERFLATLNARPHTRLGGFVILDERQRLTSRGAVRVAPTVLCFHRGSPSPRQGAQDTPGGGKQAR